MNKLAFDMPESAEYPAMTLAAGDYLHATQTILYEYEAHGGAWFLKYYKKAALNEA